MSKSGAPGCEEWEGHALSPIPLPLPELSQKLPVAQHIGSS